MYLCTDVCTYVRQHLRDVCYKCVYTCIYVLMYVHTYVRMHVCAHTDHFWNLWWPTRISTPTTPGKSSRTVLLSRSTLRGRLFFFPSPTWLITRCVLFICFYFYLLLFDSTLQGRLFFFPSPTWLITRCARVCLSVSVCVFCSFSFLRLHD